MQKMQSPGVTEQHKEMAKHRAKQLRPPAGLCVMDIETDGLYLPGDPPPQLVCAATLQLLPQGEAGKYHASVCRTWPVDVWSKGSSNLVHVPKDHMSATEILDLVEYMWSICGQKAKRRLRLGGWNLVGFDNRVLAGHCQQFAQDQGLNPDTRGRAALAWEHMLVMSWDACDPMLNFFMCRGFPVRLAAVAGTLSCSLQKNGEGAKAGELWKNGSNKDRLEVLQYCANDVVMTAAVLSELEKQGRLQWVTRKGTVSSWLPKQGAAALHAPAHLSATWPFPDNSWLKKRPRAIQHTAGDLLQQQTSGQEVASSQTVQEVEKRDLPHPKNYFGWLQ